MLPRRSPLRRQRPRERHAALTHGPSWRLVFTPSGATRIQPVIERPRISNGRVWGLASASSVPSGVTRTIRLAGAHDPYRHVAAQQERQPTEHRLLGDAVDVRELFADAVGEVLVEGHYPGRIWSSSST